MKEIDVTFTVKDSGAGVARQTVTAASDFNARRLVESQFGGPDRVRIIDSHEVRNLYPPVGGPNR
ncbi:MAG: hypothetical protein K8T26_10965 [Lentisphaerae bacterium]|nr:hypothetical protein [Lentisphaerota bacterium]